MTTQTATQAKAAPKPKAEPLPKVVITAPKGGTQTVAPRQGAIKAAIAATGKSLMAISREHDLNPSQMRRLSLDQVAKVDLTRAEAIATALGATTADLFGAPEDKTTKAAPKAAAKAAPKATAKAPARRSRASRAADKAAQDADKAG
jgi:hypothetical protein